MRVIVTGATGFVGGALCRALVARGDHVIAVSREPGRAGEKLGGGVEMTAILPTEAGGWAETLSGGDAVVNLAGASIASRWSRAYKQTIHASRVDLTRALVEGLGRLPPERRARVLVSASAVGYYGTLSDLERVETDGAGADFLAEVCRDWEDAALGAVSLGVRVAILRLGVVLGRGGALLRMLPPFRFFVGGPVAGGRQWMSWIHIDDAVALALFALDRSGVSGPINAVAPETATNAIFSKTLGRVLARPSWLPVPGFALRILMGEMSTIITRGQRANPARALSLGYSFRHPDLEGALRAILGS